MTNSATEFDHLYCLILCKWPRSDSTHLNQSIVKFESITPVSDNPWHVIIVTFQAGLKKIVGFERILFNIFTHLSHYTLSSSKLFVHGAVPNRKLSRAPAVAQLVYMWYTSV